MKAHQKIFYLDRPLLRKSSLPCRILKERRMISSGGRAPVLSTVKMMRASFSLIVTARDGNETSAPYLVHSWQSEQLSAFSISIVYLSWLIPNTFRGHLFTKVFFWSIVRVRLTTSSSMRTIGCFRMMQVETGDHLACVFPIPFLATIVRSSY